MHSTLLAYVFIEPHCAHLLSSTKELFLSSNNSNTKVLATLFDKQTLLQTSLISTYQNMASR